MDADERDTAGYAERPMEEPAERKRERRIRLLLKYLRSDSREPSVSVCEKAGDDDGRCQNDGRSIGGVDVGVKRIEEEGRAEEEQKSTKEEDVQIEKNDFLKVGEENKLVVLNKKILGSAVVNSKEALGESKVLIYTRKERQRMSSKETYSDSNHTNITSTEAVNWIERSGDIVPNKLKHGSSVISEKSNKDTVISKVKGNVLRIQCKSGVLKFLPREKKVGVGGMEIFHDKKTEDEKTNIPVSSRIAKGDTSKQPSLLEDRNAHQKLVPGDPLGENTAEGVVSLSDKDGMKLKEKCKVLSSRGDSKSVDSSASEPDMEDNINNNSKASVLKIQKIGEGNEAAGTAKQKIRDQIKSILQSAGWKIELRPRRGRKYLDSVYIPPEGKGSYWSITKAYAVYQNQLNNGHISGMPTSSLTGNNNNFDVGSSSSVIPTESLNMLRRVVVNKRRRAEELEDTEGDQRKKVKAKVKKPQPKKFKVDKTPQTRKSNNRMVSKINDTTASRVPKYLQTGRNKQKGYALLARGANKEVKLSNDSHIPYDGKRTVLAWMIDLGVVPENGKVRYINSQRRKSKLEGWITKDGIHCSCCSKTLPIAKFELHAGSKVQQPSENIYIEDEGISLLECQLTAWDKQSKSERWGFYTIDITDDDPNDDTCGICGDGGNLICCDSCPSTFHLSCLGIQMLPPGDWNCTNCSCKFCGAVYRAAVEKSDGTIPPLLSCYQCEEKYHPNCVQEIDYVSSCSNGSSSFCGQGCREIFKQLQKLLGVKNNLDAGFSWTVIRRFDDDFLGCKLSQRVECNSKTAVAFAVLDECFEPIIDRRSGISLIHNVVYNCGSNFNRLDFGGFYTFILERGDEIISAASVRIHGTKLAEMPFIGTRNVYRRQGMCRRLLDGIETALRSLNVEKLVIPAISELKNTWTTIFGFMPFEASQELEVRSINILVFPGTGLLLKPLAAADTVAKVEGNIRQHGGLAVPESSEIEDIRNTSNEVVLHLSQHIRPNYPVSDYCVNHEMTSTNDSSILKLHNADDEYLKYTAEVKCILKDDFASNIQESGYQGVTEMLSMDSKLVKHDVLDLIQQQTATDGMLVSDNETKQVVNQVPKESSSAQGTCFLGRTAGSPACSPVTKKCHIAGHKYLQTSVLPALSEPVINSNGRDTSQ